MTALLAEMNAAVTSALTEIASQGRWRTYQGPSQEGLMAALAGLTACPHVGLASSGTAALELLLRARRLTTGDEVLLAAYDYPGNFAAIERVGARPVLVDTQAHGWNVDWSSLEAAHSPACKVLIASHLHGQLQDMPQLRDWCESRNMWLIQDACQALGASWQGKSITSFSHATILSFGGSKVLSAGRGGAWCTPDAGIAQHARLAAGVGSGTSEMSELQAAVVLAQLPFLERINTACRTFFVGQARRLANANRCALVAPWIGVCQDTAFYQAGWLAGSPEERTQFLSAEDSVAGWGPGFSGFHRRSVRRCRRSELFRHAPSICERTIVLHHRAALVGPTVTGLGPDQP